MGWDPAQAPAGLPHTYTHIPARTSQSSQRVQATPAPPSRNVGRSPENSRLESGGDLSDPPHMPGSPTSRMTAWGKE